MKKDKARMAFDEKEIVAKHFARLTHLLKQEESLEKETFKRDILDRNPEERQKRGKALLRLALIERHFTPAGQVLITFAFKNRQPLPRHGLFIGDVVELSGFQTSREERLIGTVYERERTTLTVVFSHKLPGWVGHSQHYDLCVSENKTTFDRMFHALREVGRAAHNEPAWLRDLSLGLRKVHSYDAPDLKKIEWLNRSLNELQKEAVAKALSIKDILLIHGPPGTGKTSVLVEIVRQIVKRKESVLLSAPSNAACDHLVGCLVREQVPVTRLGHPARMTESLRQHTLAYKLVDHPHAKLMDKNEARIAQLDRQHSRRQDRRVLSRDERREMREEFRDLRQDNRNLQAEIFRQVWLASDVVVATHTVCGDPKVKGKKFDWIIIDEATQSIEPGTWIPLSSAGKVIMAGDHRQLPPTVLNMKRGKDSLFCSLFERLHDVLPASSKIQLTRQYRMNEAIMKFSSKEFYDDHLVADESAKRSLLHDLSTVKKSEITEHPLTFIDTAGLGYEEKKKQGELSPYNEDEAKIVVRQVNALLESGLAESDIAVISPYSAQVKLLSSMLQKDEWAAERGAGIRVDSIDAFQGQENEAIIVSLVRSNLLGQIGFLGDTRRMNVALTRAKRKLIVIGDSATLSSLPFYEDFIKYTETLEGAYKSAWEFVA